MTRKIMVLFAFLVLYNVETVRALTIDECNVLGIVKYQSSDDENNYICEGKELSSKGISYSGSNNTIKIDNANIYYFEFVKQDLTLELSGNNEIYLLHTVNNLKINGNGTLRFKEASFVKKNNNGSPVNIYEYNKKIVLKDKKIYEGTIEQFENDYEVLKSENKLPEDFNIENFVITQYNDYSKMNPIAIPSTWLDKYITTDLSIETNNGYALIGFTKKDEKTLEKDNVIFISETNIDKKYELEVNDLKNNEELTNKINMNIESHDLIGLYDISVHDDKNKHVEVKNGNYTIKIKIDESINNYTDYQVIYIDDDGNIKEYIKPTIEDGYMVFNTTHLSQYGIIALDNSTSQTIIINPQSGINKLNIIKILILVSSAIVSITMIITIKVKSTKKRKRA